MVSDADAGLRHHFQIVCTVAHRDDLFGFESQFLAYLHQPVSLALRVQDFAQYFTGELAVDNFKGIGVGVVQTQPYLETLGKKYKTTGHQQRLDAARLECLKHGLRAGRKPQVFIIHALQSMFVQPCQQCNTAA